MFCKTIILSNSENLNNNAPKGILTLSNQNNHILGKIRLYNLNSLPFNTKIGLYANDKVHISNITKKPNHYEFELNDNIDISQSIYCALIDNSNNDKKVLLEGGSFNGFYFTDSPFDAILEAKDEELEQTIDKAMHDVDACNSCNCTDCEYKKYFYQHYSANNQPNTNVDCDHKSSILKSDASLLNQDKFQNNVIASLENEIADDVVNAAQTVFEQDQNNGTIADTSSQPMPNPETESTEFLNDIIYQLDEMLTKYPADDMLNSIIPNSKFVYVDSDKPYVLGVIYENSQLKYIAYGVPATYNSLPPNDLGQHYQWLPLNPKDVMSDGYFMIYQNALTGSLVEINFEE